MNPTVIFNDEEDVNVNVDNIYDIPDFVRAEEERKSNEIRRETYYENFIERVENGEFKGDAALINGVNTLNIEAGTNISLQQTNGTLTINNTYSYNDSQINQKITNLELEQTTQNNNIQTNASSISSINNTLPNLATKSEIPTKTSDLINDSNFANTNDIPTDLSQLSNATTQFVNQNQMTSAINTEQTSRQNADINLQSQIDAITVSSDVVDVVGTYLDLQNYSTSSLTDDDIVKVLEDSTHNNALSYYRWVITSNVGSWQYVGSEGPFYTKSEADANLTNYVQNTDYATGSTAGVFKSANSLAVNGTGQVQAQTLDFETYSSRANTIFVGKGTLENVIAGKKLINQTTLDETEEEINTTLTNQEQEILLNSEDIKLLATELEDNTVEIEDETQITDSTNYYGNVDKISGEEITQKTYTGSNLLNPVPNTLANTLNGISVTRNTDGSLDINGTATSNWANIINKISTNLEPNTYKFIIDSELSHTIVLRLTYSDETYSDLNIVAGNKKREITTTKTIVSYYVYLILNEGTTYSEKVYLQLKLSSSSEDYEPYVGGTASPNPDYPQAIQNVTGLQNIEVCGKNLLDISDITNTGEITNNGDGSITLDGTIYGGTSYSLTKPFTLKANTPYTLSLTNTNTSYHGATFILRNGDTNKFLISYSESEKHYTPTEDVVIDTLRIFGAELTFDNYTFSVQLEQGSTATSYEEYKGQNFELNLGKNLFDKDNANIVEGYINAPSGSITAYSERGVVWIQCQPNTTYTISKISSARFAVSTYPVKPEIGVSSSINNAIRNDTATNITITSGANDNYLGVWLYNAEEDTLTRQQIIDTLQIEKGPKATPYSPYFTPIELGTKWGYENCLNYNNGNWYFHQEIGKVVLDGSESWQSEAAANGYYRYNVASYLNSLSSNAMNNRFTERINQGHGEYEYCYVQNDVGSVHIQLLQNRISSSSVNDFKNWLSNNKVDLYYILSTPTNTLITSENYPELYEQLQEISKFLMYQGVNNFSITSENLKAKLNLTYKRSNLLRLKSLESTINGLIDGDEVNY